MFWVVLGDLDLVHCFLNGNVERRSSVAVLLRDGGLPLVYKSLHGVWIASLHCMVQWCLAVLVSHVDDECVPQEIGKTRSQLIRLCDCTSDYQGALDSVHNRPIVCIIGAFESTEAMCSQGLFWDERHIQAFRRDGRLIS